MKIDQDELSKMSKEELLEWIFIFLDELKLKYRQTKN